MKPHYAKRPLKSLQPRQCPKGHRYKTDSPKSMKHECPVCLLERFPQQNFTITPDDTADAADTDGLALPHWTTYRFELLPPKD